MNMLYSVAILLSPTIDERANGAPTTVLYGPVAIVAAEHDYQGAGFRVIAEASAAGKLPNGWDASRMHVVALRYSDINGC